MYAPSPRSNVGVAGTAISPSGQLVATTTLEKRWRFDIDSVRHVGVPIGTAALRGCVEKEP
jgi:hypothetical protein